MLASGDAEYADGIPVTVGTTLSYLIATTIGGFLGGLGAWLAYRQHYDAGGGPAAILGSFSTGPEVRPRGWHLVPERLGAFVPLLGLPAVHHTPHEMGPLAVALLVVSIGASLGGPTGYAINPARDLGPRLAHAILPIKNKGTSDWGYAWVPVLGPFIGGALGGVTSIAF